MFFLHCKHLLFTTFKELLPDSQINFLYVYVALKFFEVVFCECKTIPEQLAEMGMFPGSLKNTQFAIHFGLLEFMRNLRNVLATSDQGLVDLYNKVNPASEKQMTKTFFKSIFPAYTKLMMLVEDRGKNVSPASIGSEGFSACPNVSKYCDI
ncbi:hypothetical protein J3Q64DRAFT_1020590 [Phycomyces blakesleeanus]|uniref:Ndc10 domain-containing protein n=1 Tax=Phycomyces blakesleeanus TaxID=4837 RepID=A0ABR3BDD9_PHYBL